VLGGAQQRRGDLAQERPPERQRQARRPLPRPGADRGRIVVGRIEVAKVVGGQAERGGDLEQPRIAARRGEADTDVRQLRSDTVDQRPAAEVLFTLRNEVQPVPARRQFADRRLEVAKIGEVPGDEQDVHASLAIAAGCGLSMRPSASRTTSTSLTCSGTNDPAFRLEKTRLATSR
jgi:hypothetical protein